MACWCSRTVATPPRAECNLTFLTLVSSPRAAGSPGVFGGWCWCTRRRRRRTRRRRGSGASRTISRKCRSSSRHVLRATTGELAARHRAPSISGLLPLLAESSPPRLAAALDPQRALKTTPTKQASSGAKVAGEGALHPSIDTLTPEHTAVWRRKAQLMPPV